MIVGLRAVERTEAVAPTDNVEDDGRKIHLVHVGNALLLEGDARAGGGRQYAVTAGGRTHDDVDAGQLALGLHKRAAQLRHTAGEIFHCFRGRRDGIARVDFHTRSNGSFCNGNVALYHIAHYSLPPSLIVKTASGQTM